MASLADLQAYATQQAINYGIPPSLFLWQIGQESGWNPSITSDGGAHLGLGQFDTATAAQYGVDRLDPYSSLHGAALYDKQLFGAYGSWKDALTRYGTIGPNVPQSVNDAGAAAIANSNCPWWKFWTPECTNFTIPAPTVNTAIKSATGFDPAQIGSYATRGVVIAIGLILLAGGLFLFGTGQGKQIVKEIVK